MIDIETSINETITKIMKPIIKKQLTDEGYLFTDLVGCGYNGKEYELSDSDSDSDNTLRENCDDKNCSLRTADYVGKRII
jgi:hypothetical protein